MYLSYQHPYPPRLLPHYLWALQRFIHPACHRWTVTPLNRIPNIQQLELNLVAVEAQLEGDSIELENSTEQRPVGKTVSLCKQE